MYAKMSSHTRRRALALLGTASVGLAGCLSRGDRAGGLGQVEGEWPVVGRESGQTRSVGEGPIDPETVWTTELDDARAAGTPSIADGRVYVPVDAVADRARRRYRLHALAAGTGEERWQVPLRSDPNPSPAIRGNRIIVSARRGVEQGRLVAFEERYGDEEWLHDVDARVTAPPTIDGTAVYLPDWDGYVHALSIADGSVRWSRQVGPDGENRTFTQPVAIHDETLYLGSLSGRTGVIAVDAATGAERWSRSTDRVTGGPVVDDGFVAVRGGTLLAAFGTDGVERWTFNVPGDGRESTLALDDQHVYVPAGDALYAIERSGEKAWSYELSDEGAGPPTVVGDEVLIYENGELTALARTDGTTRWSADTDGSGEVVATPDAIVMSGPGGRVTALGRSNR